MTVRIAVVDPLPMFQQGVVAVLGKAGYPVDVPDDVLAWLRRGGAAVVVLTVRSGDDWDMLRRLRAVPPLPHVIVLLDDDSVAASARAVQAGARSVMPRGVTVNTLLRTVEATIDGQAVMPAAVAVALAYGSAIAPAVDAAGPTTTRPGLSADQLSWLRQLAAGSTVAQIADRAGYSERAMFRLLRAAYEQIGVRTRIQAIMRAKDAGWL
ncbi:MAG TPA: DNA-binding response regulator [Micromonosporaceae bacterium]|nr:DNA-binding response regulator [Micromonosporaceae bacterium]